MKVIRMVALGDSLTVGYIPFRIATQPYSRFLRAMTEDYLKQVAKNSVIDVRIINHGVNGDLTSGMLFRFRRDVIQVQATHVIVLGGTNDLGWGFPVQEILSNIQRMYEMARTHAIHPIGCTVPSIRGWDEGIALRRELNRAIQQYCGEMKIPCVDLFTATCDPTTQRLQAEYSSDGLHMNASGYQILAEAIFQNAIQPLLNH
jgi:lysophospholipase L1-like esterase